jgi:hypothetical protein
LRRCALASVVPGAGCRQLGVQAGSASRVQGCVARRPATCSRKCTHPASCCGPRVPPQAGSLKLSSNLAARMSAAQQRMLTLNRGLAYLLCGRVDAAREVVNALLRQDTAAAASAPSAPWLSQHLLPLLNAAVLAKEGKVGRVDANVRSRLSAHTALPWMLPPTSSCCLCSPACKLPCPGSPLMHPHGLLLLSYTHRVLRRTACWWQRPQQQAHPAPALKPCGQCSLARSWPWRRVTARVLPACWTPWRSLWSWPAVRPCWLRVSRYTSRWEHCVVRK